MRIKRLGRTGLQVTEIGLGAIPIQRRTLEDGARVVERCLELGINFIDTANGYTDSEEKIGRAIAGRRREELVIATKSNRRDKKGVLEHIDLSLRRLGTDYLDLLQLHNLTTLDELAQVTGPGGAMEGLREAQEAGKLRHIGVTSHSFANTPAFLRTGLFETIQIPFNFIATDAEREIFPLAQAMEIGVIGMKPFAGGAIEDARLAFKFLQRYDFLVSIPGIEVIAEVEAIARIIEERPSLTPADEAEIERIRAELGTRFCRRCQYCYPCPQGIKVALVNGIDSFIRRMPRERMLTGWIAEALAEAQGCQQCGLCEERCPYHLPVRELLQEGLDTYARWRETSTLS
ncbi:MAG: aldo/keto reductase [Candidatus Tectomicrobia bacterium]|uniref:Aldo/keto reductase n=1 Tax=Tectimicrobiota bacterium TaxID=2528274 RepID=A0A932CPZ1_UNCTE|nr:aldo/keto reductase [Candidatus Tectomicrobia bacterium]